MIFTSLGLLVVAAGLLIAGIAKSSVALLMTSLLLTLGAGVVLAMVLPATRRLNASTNAHGNGHGTMMATANGQPVVLYVQQAPAQGSAVPEIDLTNGAPVIGYDQMSAQQVAKLIASGALTEEQL